MKSYLRLILYQNMKQNLAVFIHPNVTFYRHVFAHIYYVIHELAHTDIYLDERTLIPLLIVIKRWTWYQNAWKNVPNMMTENIWRLYVAKCQNAQKTRAHARLSDFLSNAPYGLKRMQKKIGNDLEHFKFLRARKRAHERVRADLRTFFDLEIDRKDIDLIHDKYEWKITFRYEDMIISWFLQNGAWMTSR